MRFWIDSSVLPIGVDIGARSIKMLQFRHSTGQLSLIAAAAAEIPDPGSADPEVRARVVTDTLKKLLAPRTFIGNACVSALPTTLLHTKSVRLPPMPESDLAQAVRWEAKDRFGFDLTDGHLEYFRAGEVRRGTEVKDELLLFAATADVLRGHIDQLANAGLNLHAIDLQPCALHRAVQRITPARAGIATALVDIGAGGSQLVIAQNDRLVFYKHIEIGATALDTAVSQKLGVPLHEAAQLRARLLGPASAAQNQDPSVHLTQAVFDAVRAPLEELGRELDMCIRYYVVTFRGTRPEVLTLTGIQSQCARVTEALSSILALHIEPAQPLRGVTNLSEITRPDRASQWTLAAGLSLYSLAQSQRAHATEAAA